MDLDLILARAGIASNCAEYLHQTELRMVLDHRLIVGPVGNPPPRLAADDAQVHDQLIAVEWLRGNAARNEVPPRLAVQPVLHERPEVFEANVLPDARAELGSPLIFAARL